MCRLAGLPRRGSKRCWGQAAQKQEQFLAAARKPLSAMAATPNTQRPLLSFSSQPSPHPRHWCGTHVPAVLSCPPTHRVHIHACPSQSGNVSNRHVWMGCAGLHCGASSLVQPPPDSLGPGLAPRRYPWCRAPQGRRLAHLHPSCPFCMIPSPESWWCTGDSGDLNATSCVDNSC